MKTLKTTNYGLFTNIVSNRPVTESHVESIVHAIKKKDLTEANPILVNEKFEIIDGQHRLKACEKLGLPVYYFMVELNGGSNQAMIDLNCLQKTWRLPEFIHHYAIRGREDYKKLMDCEAMFRLGASNTIAIVSNQGSSKSKDIRTGKFKAGKRSWVELGNIVMDFKKIIPDFYKELRFVQALVTLVVTGVYKHKEHFKKFEKNRFHLQPCANSEQYRKMFEYIINKGKRKNDLKAS